MRPRMRSRGTWGLLGAALAFAARTATPQAPQGVRTVPTHTPTPASGYGKGLLVIPTPTATPKAPAEKVPPHSREFVIGFTGSTPARSREVRVDFVGKPVAPGRVPRP